MPLTSKDVASFSRAVPKDDPVNWAELICQTGGLMSPTECAELGRWALQAEGDALEVGHYTGLSTCVLLACLPRSAQLWTIDDHSWRKGTRAAFSENVESHIDREFFPIFGDYKRSLPGLPSPFSFVFYDGPHSDGDCEVFWAMVAPKLTARCLLLFDDADWASMSRLRDLAGTNGFEVVTDIPFTRYPIPYATGDRQVDLDLGKRHPDTYTLEVMRRT